MVDEYELVNENESDRDGVRELYLEGREEDEWKGGTRRHKRNLKEWEMKKKDENGRGERDVEMQNRYLKKWRKGKEDSGN